MKVKHGIDSPAGRERHAKIGFDIFEHPNMPTVTINRTGFVCLPYALLTAFSPIEPSDESLLSRAVPAQPERLKAAQSITVEHQGMTLSEVGDETDT